jgi:hypothetical protein
MISWTTPPPPPQIPEKMKDRPGTYLTRELQWEPELLMTLVSIRTFGPHSNVRMIHLSSVKILKNRVLYFRNFRLERVVVASHQKLR